ncbi:hypothetical protein GUJ93_ZPchr0006g43524 [Zizania palustris]|uniref:Uncharacterized protein n=1 Tax=Zizania palustris TaxID=103762 RepID=A0A8J5W4C0_ZIZPA|nr:hypothetical protein GUJ93_ZPchr0006g43524 [Zizania palustris]
MVGWVAKEQFSLLHFTQPAGSAARAPCEIDPLLGSDRAASPSPRRSSLPPLARPPPAASCLLAPAAGVLGEVLLTSCPDLLEAGRPAVRRSGSGGSRGEAARGGRRRAGEAAHPLCLRRPVGGWYSANSSLFRKDFCDSAEQHPRPWL